MSHAYANLPNISFRASSTFLTEFLETCDDSDAYEVARTVGRVVSLSAPADAVLDIYASALRTSDARHAPRGTQPHITADALRTVGFLDQDVSWMRKDAVRQAERRVALTAQLDLGPPEVPNPGDSGASELTTRGALARSGLLTF